MKNQVLTFQEEVDITRRQVMTYEYKALLVWGWTTVALATAIYLLDLLTGDRHWEYLWLALPVVAGVLHVNWAKETAGEPTSLYMMLSRVSRMVIGAIFICAVSAFFCNFNVWAVIVLILALWAGFTSFMLDYPKLRPACIGGIAIAIGLLYVKGIDCIAVFSSGVIATLLLPGYIMRHDLRRSKG